MLLLLLLVLAVFFLSGEGWVQRLARAEADLEVRMHVYEQTWQATEQAPLTGYGIGSYQQTFPLFADQRSSPWRRAHNDWLEMIFELGKPAALLWFALLASLTLRCAHGFFHRRRDHIYPAVAFSATTLLALGVSQSRSSKE